jgi:hypothetical protein
MLADYFKDSRFRMELAACGFWGLLFGAVAGAVIGGGSGCYREASEFYRANAANPVWALIGGAFAGLYGLAVAMPRGLAIGAAVGLALGIVRGIYHYHHG